MNEAYAAMRPRTMRLALLALVLILTCVICPAAAEPPPAGDGFSVRYRNCAYVLFLEDGGMIFATRRVGDGLSTLEQIERVDADGTLLWSRPLPPGLVGFMTRILQNEDGKIVLCGKEPNGPWHILTISPDGASLRDQTLPDNAYIPALVPDGLYYTTFGPEGEAPGLWKLDKQGGARQIPIPAMESVNTWSEVAVSGDAAILPILYRNLEGESVMGILSLDAQDGLRWQYDVGPLSDWMILDQTCNNLGGATLFVQEHPPESDEARAYLLCLDGDGQVAWKVEIACEGKFPTPQIMEQEANGDYTVWGIAQTPQNRDELITFKLTLDQDGNFVSNEFKPLWGDCHRYLGGEVYAVVDPFGEAILSRFDDLPNAEMADFTVTRR